MSGFNAVTGRQAINQEANLAEIAAKVTEVLADLILMAPPDEQSTLMADMLATLGGFLREKKEAATQLIRAVQTLSNISLSDRPTFSFRRCRPALVISPA
jgi:hypothetical protein